jgi:hypothetical protein
MNLVLELYIAISNPHSQQDFTFDVSDIRHGGMWCCASGIAKQPPPLDAAVCTSLHFAGPWRTSETVIFLPPSLPLFRLFSLFRG